MDFPTSGTVRNECLLFKPPSLCSVMAAPAGRVFLTLHFRHGKDGLHIVGLLFREMRKMEGESKERGCKLCSPNRGYRLEPSVTVFMSPLCLFCKCSAAFKFLSDDPENPGGVFVCVFSNTVASCIFYQKSHFIHWLFSQPIVYSSPPFLFFRNLSFPEPGRFRTLHRI